MKGEKQMNLTTMTKEELISLKNNISKELNNRIKKDYQELKNKLIELITDFENKTGYYVVVDMDDDGIDRGSNFIKGVFYYTDEYVAPFE